MIYFPRIDKIASVFFINRNSPSILILDGGLPAFEEFLLNYDKSPATPEFLIIDFSFIRPLRDPLTDMISLSVVDNRYNAFS
jgi:hypothetical protein